MLSKSMNKTTKEDYVNRSTLRKTHWILWKLFNRSTTHLKRTSKILGLKFAKILCNITFANLGKIVSPPKYQATIHTAYLENALLANFGNSKSVGDNTSCHKFGKFALNFPCKAVSLWHLGVFGELPQAAQSGLAAAVSYVGYRSSRIVHTLGLCHAHTQTWKWSTLCVTWIGVCTRLWKKIWNQPRCLLQ